MPFLRLLLRVAPFVVGAVAVAVWLRRRQAARAQLPAAPEPPAIEPPPATSERPRSGRFDREPIDIVTVVDDLLMAGR